MTTATLIQEEVCSLVLLTTTHQADKSHLHPPCQLRYGGGEGAGTISFAKDISLILNWHSALSGMMLFFFLTAHLFESEKTNLLLVY